MEPKKLHLNAKAQKDLKELQTLEVSLTKLSLLSLVLALSSTALSLLSLVLS